MFGDEAIIEMAILEREAWVKIIAKHAAQQHGECFADRRDETSHMRGPDRRAA